MSVVKVPKKANIAQWTGLMKSKSNRGGVTRGRRSLESSVRVPRTVYRENAVLRIYNTYYIDIWKSTRLNK